MEMGEEKDLKICPLCGGVPDYRRSALVNRASSLLLHLNSEILADIAVALQSYEDKEDTITTQEMETRWKLAKIIVEQLI